MNLKKVFGCAAAGALVAIPVPVVGPIVGALVGGGAAIAHELGKKDGPKT